MEGMELICFQIITANGSAKSCYIEALQEVKKGNYARADELIAEGDKMVIEGHDIHLSLLAKESEGKKTEISLLLLHAEDQAMSTEVIKIMVLELIELYKERDKKGTKS